MPPKVFIILFSGISVVLLAASLRSGTRLFQWPPTAPKWPAQIEKKSDLQGRSPLEFIDALKEMGQGPVVFGAQIEGWVTKEHQASLIALVDSHEPCASVMLGISSYFESRSTVGAEALCMLAGIRAGKYPPWLNSNRPDEHPGETLAWVRAQAAPK